MGGKFHHHKLRSRPPWHGSSQCPNLVWTFKWSCLSKLRRHLICVFNLRVVFVALDVWCQFGLSSDVALGSSSSGYRNSIWTLKGRSPYSGVSMSGLYGRKSPITSLRGRLVISETRSYECPNSNWILKWSCFLVKSTYLLLRDNCCHKVLVLLFLLLALWYEEGYFSILRLPFSLCSRNFPHCWFWHMLRNSFSPRLHLNDALKPQERHCNLVRLCFGSSLGL